MSDFELSEENPFLAMLAVTEAFAPLFDTAQGFKSKLIEDGWTEETAEAVAREFLVSATRMCMKGVTK